MLKIAWPGRFFQVCFPGFFQLLGISWFVLVFIFLSYFYYVVHKPANPGSSPSSWPPNDWIKASSGIPTLILAVHPRCPCSDDTLTELGKLQTTLGSHQLEIHLLFYQPLESSPDWVEGKLWNQAKAMEAVTLHRDPGGHKAIQFGLATSGQVVVYDKQGKKLFGGGITIGSICLDENPSSRLLAKSLKDSIPLIQETPVYGCSLGLKIGSTDQSAGKRVEFR